MLEGWLGLYAIINRHSPDLLDYNEECQIDTPLVNLSQRELDVIKLLDLEGKIYSEIYWNIPIYIY
jgi:hypothetical protein